MDFVVSDESVNSYGLRVLTDGIITDRFEKNPVMLYSHDDYNRLPIGKWTNLKKARGKMTATANFDEQDDFAQKVKGKAEQKIIQMASLGIIPLEWSDDPELMVQGQSEPTITKCILREISITPFGSNHNAFRMYDKQGNEIKLSEATKMFNKDQKTKAMSQTNLKLLLTTGLNLSEDMADSELVKHCINLSQQVQTLKEEKQNVQKELDELKKKDEVKLKEELVNQAVKEQKITEKQKAVYLGLSYEQAKNLLDTIEKPVNLNEYTQGNGGDEKNEKRKDWTFKDWTQKDPEGLEEMKGKDPECYKLLFKEEYKVEPKL